MNNTITEMKDTLEGINNRISEAEERISELEDRMVEITAEEQNKEKRMKRIEDNLRYNTKYSNIQIIGVPEEEEKKKGSEKLFEEIIIKNFPKMGKAGGGVCITVWEAWPQVRLPTDCMPSILAS